ncbi:putative ethanolamine kinase [Carex littledalei]|uniref:ethanolamine kinase n=1 Tax=Carex littledalei TaxID=544730 RepID=A0A833RDK9_9POAL|nr:putative ethanolamine kinase [Carex littledalei]
MGAEDRSWDPVSAMEEATAGASNGNAPGVPTVPSSPLSIDISLPLPEMKPYIIHLLKTLFQKWSSLDSSCFTIETVSGGITNLLLKVCVQEDSLNESILTVRLYGPNTDLVIDRERELNALPYLSAAGFGAELLGVFSNGMVQSFIDARTLEPSDMRNPKIATEIAKELRRFHQVYIPVAKEPQLWNDIFRFLKKSEKLEFDDDEKQSKYEEISFTEIHKQVNELKDLTDQLNSPTVFSHNDLLSGNIMLNDSQGKLYFIDFEYGSYSYRGYDIANHFNEYAGFDCDYNQYPKKEAQYHFFRSYMKPDNPQAVPERELEALYIETNTFRLASHIYWALWALIQAKVSPIDFDYLGYFFLRYNEYKKQKESCFSLAKSFLSVSDSA